LVLAPGLEPGDLGV